MKQLRLGANTIREDWRSLLGCPSFCWQANRKKKTCPNHTQSISSPSSNLLQGALITSWSPLPPQNMPKRRWPKVQVSTLAEVTGPMATAPAHIFFIVSLSNNCRKDRSSEEQVEGFFRLSGQFCLWGSSFNLHQRFTVLRTIEVLPGSWIRTKHPRLPNPWNSSTSGQPFADHLAWQLCNWSDFNGVSDSKPSVVMPWHTVSASALAVWFREINSSLGSMWPVPKRSVTGTKECTGAETSLAESAACDRFPAPWHAKRLCATKKRKWCTRLGGGKSRMTQVAYNLAYRIRSQHCFFNGCCLTTRVPSRGRSTCKIWSGLCGCALVSDAQNQTMWTYANNNQCATVQFSSVWGCGAWLKIASKF